MGKKQTNEKAKETGMEDPSLLDDVKAFAAELGFGTGGDGMEFSDFAPERAGKKIQKGDAIHGNSKEQKGNKKKNMNTENSGSAKQHKQGNALQAKTPQKNHTKGAPQKPDEKVEAANSNKGRLRSAPEKGKNGAVQQQKINAGARSLLRRDDPSPWWEIELNIPQSEAKSFSTEILEDKRQIGEDLLQNESLAFEADAQRKKGDSSLQWLQQAQRAGTTSDKIAAMAVMVQESPIANLRALDGLLRMVNKKGGARSVVGTTLDALRELWVDVLLPPNRKLKFLQQQNLEGLSKLSSKESNRAILIWSFEEQLKKKYATFVESLESLTRDNLEFVKDRAIRTVYDLLVARPEQEAVLLSALVNKLGDPDRKLASKSGYFLSKLLSIHPGMKHVAVREIEKFVFRPGLADRARYYAVIYLNQIVLTQKDKTIVGKSSNGPTLARKLVDLYFTLFKLIIEGQLGTAASLATAASEKASRKAEEFAARKGKKSASKYIEKEKEKQEKEQAKKMRQMPGELDSRMLAALITGVRRAFPYVAPEEVEPLIEANTGALFRLIHVGSFGVATQALLLLHQLMTARNAESDRFYRALYATLNSPELTTSTKAPMFLSLVFKTIKDDVLPRRAAAFVKRLLQVSLEAPSQFACGCLVMLSEILKSTPRLWNAILQPEDKDEDAVEVFQDLDADADADEASQEKTQNASIQEVGNSGSDIVNGIKTQSNGGSGYDMRKRDPQYANADRSCLWELLILARHAHPSVAAMARTLLAGANVSYFGDPLRDLTLAAFLDKFVEKKAKKGVVSRGDSLMQPLKTARTSEQVNASLALGATFDYMAEKEVAPDDEFFHRFYLLQAASTTKKKSRAARKRAMEEDEILSDASSDSAEIDALLDAEEDGGEEGLGADPDRNLEYDYGALAEAMDESSSSTTSAADSDEELADLSDGDATELLDGAQFSDMSSDSSEDENDKPTKVPNRHMSEAMRSESDSLISQSEDVVDSESNSMEGDSEADAEVSSLMKALENSSGMKNSTVDGNDSENEVLDINPFDLAQGNLTEDGETDDYSQSDSEGDFNELINDEPIESDKGGIKSGKFSNKKDAPIFASAEDYMDMIDRDFLDEEDQQEARPKKRNRNPTSRGSNKKRR